jgi:hypothetical protein
MTHVYLKSYCYSKHELPFVLANLSEGYEYIDKLILYEYNYTHTGIKKKYNMEEVLHLIPEKLKEKLYYKKVDITDYVEYAYENGPLIHAVNEPIQRSWFFNDENFDLKDNDIIIDHDIDEIIYSYEYPRLINEMVKKQQPLSIRLNQFYFRHNYLWADCNFSSPTIYFYGHVKNGQKIIKGKKIKNLRDLPWKTDNIYGCHMSWIMPASYMIKKLHSYSHPEYRKYADLKKLQEAIDKKIYIFDTNREFNIDELKLNDKRIPKILQKKEIFDYLIEPNSNKNL